MNRKGDKLTVELHEDTIFLHPRSDSNPSDDPFLRGSITLFLAAPRRVKHLQITLEGILTMHGGSDSRYETGQTLLKMLELDLGAELLQKGTHGCVLMSCNARQLKTSTSGPLAQTCMLTSAGRDADINSHS